MRVARSKRGWTVRPTAAGHVVVTVGSDEWDIEVVAAEIER
jgi:hypothetical protein